MVLDPLTSFALFFIAFILMALAGIPIFASLGLSGIAVILLAGKDITIAIKSFMMPFQSFPMLGVFLFTLMGTVFERTQLTKYIIDAVEPAVGRVKGGLAISVAVSSAFFGLLTGSVAATAAAFSRLTGPEMERRGYPKSFAGSVICASAPLGAFIPPSIPGIIIAVATGTSVITMFMIGAGLGIILLAGLSILIFAISYRNNYGGVVRRYTWSEFGVNVLKTMPILVAPLGVLWSIYFGVFSVTEAGALGAAASFAVAALYRKLTLRKVLEIFVEASKTTGMILLLIGSSYIISFAFSLTGINAALISLLRDLGSQYVHMALLFLAAILAALGCFLDVIVLAIALGAVTVSALTPLGVNPYHINSLYLYGVLLGTCTPPVGAAVFVVSQTLNLPIEKLSRSIWVFVLLYLTLYVALIFIPELALWLPRLLRLPL
ncbi:MAG: TRAP transporter large permease subunit [Zestosphaera sp.]